MGSSTIQRGDVVQLDFPFSGGDGSKSRPALVIAGPTEHGDYVVVMMSSQRHDDGVTIEPADFSVGGLTSMGYARVRSVYTVNGATFSQKRGALKPNALKRVHAALCPALGCE